MADHPGEILRETTAPGQNLVLFLTAGPSLAACVPIRRDRPLPGTLDPFRLRFTLTPHPRVRASP